MGLEFSLIVIPSSQTVTMTSSFTSNMNSKPDQLQKQHRHKPFPACDDLRPCRALTSGSFPGGRRREVEGRQMYLLLLLWLQFSSVSFIHALNHTLLERRPDLVAAAAGKEAQVCNSPAHQGPQLLNGKCSFCGLLGDDAPVERVKLLFVLLLMLSILLPGTH